MLASVSIRDPREIALAMVDHGLDRDYLRRQAEFTECRTVLDALPSLDNQIANLQVIGRRFKGSKSSATTKFALIRRRSWRALRRKSALPLTQSRF